MKRIVMKFGGTSVGDAEALRSSAAIIQRVSSEVDQVVVVISAMAGMTDQLIQCLKIAQQGDSASCGCHIAEIQAQIIDKLTDLFAESIPETVKNCIVEKFSLLTRICGQVQIQHQITPKNYAVVVSLGECINVVVLSALLRENGLNSTPVEATRLIITDNQFYNASPIKKVTRRCIQDQLVPLLEKGTIPVVTGFIGATKNGEITTLGRGGSDFSAAILARELDANELWIWKDVDGILTTDPKMLPEAQLIREISFNETYELTFFGAKVLHPKTLLTARDGDIPIRIMNTFHPRNPGTLITPQAGEQQASSFKAVTGIDHVFLVSVEGLGEKFYIEVSRTISNFLLQQGKEVLSAFETAKDHSLHFAVREEPTQDEIRAIQQSVAKLVYPGNSPYVFKWVGKGIVSVIGENRSNQGISLDKTLAQAGVNTGSYRCQNSNNSMQYLIPVHQVKNAIQSIHNEVILNEQCK